jgi:hypothetical protein
MILHATHFGVRFETKDKEGNSCETIGQCKEMHKTNMNLKWVL